MMRLLAHRLPAVQRPTAGGRFDGFWGHFMAPHPPTTARFCTVAKAPARGAVGRCAAARMAHLEPAQRGFGAEVSCHG